MKKILALMLCALAIVTVTSCGSLLSEEEKEVRAAVKDLKKDGWKVVGDENLTTVVSKHMEKIYASKKDSSIISAIIEFIGSGNGDIGDFESGKVAARNDAVRFSAYFWVDEWKNDASPEALDRPEFDSFCKNFVTIFSKKLAEELTPSFYVYQKIDGTIYYSGNKVIEDGCSVMGYFLINRERYIDIVMAARKEAAEAAGIKLNMDTTTQEANQ